MMRYLFIPFFVAAAMAYNNGMAQKPPLGWNTWCTSGTCGQNGTSPGKNPLHDVCTEDEIKEIAHAMVSTGLFGLGYTHINLDDCWIAEERLANGSITWATSRFPSGIPALTSWLHARGFSFGLYSSMGTTTCNNNGRTWPDLKPGTWPRSGSYGHYKEDAASFAAWGVDYVKMDWCGIEKTKMSTTDAHTLHANFSYWMNATGRHMHLELCRGYSYHPLSSYVPEVANSWRVAGDNWDWWPHTVGTINDFVGESYLAGPYNWNYGDFLMTGGAGCGSFNVTSERHCPGQNDAEYRTQFAVYAICASPLIVGTDVRDFTPIMKSILLNKEMLAVNQDYLAPAGDLITRFDSGGKPTEDSKKGTLLLWARFLTTGAIAMGVTNLQSTTAKLRVDFALFNRTGWNASTRAIARDLWAQEPVKGVHEGKVTMTVAPHDTPVWSLTLASDVTITV